MKAIKNDYFELFEVENSKTLLVICSSADRRKGQFSFYKKSKLLGTNVLYLNTPNSNWYRNGIPGIEEPGIDNLSAFKNFLNKIKEELNIDHVYFMGISMGAYGAILLGTLNNAEKILAFSGEVLLGLPGGRTGPVRNQFWPIYPDLRILKFENVTALYGELNIPDTLGAYLIQEHSPSNKIYRVRFASHDVAVKLNERGLFSEVVSRFINGEDITIHDFVEPYKIKQKYCQDCLILNKYALDNDWITINRFINRLPSEEFNNSLLLLLLYSTSFYKLGKLQEAKKFLINMILQESRNEGFWSLLASCYIKENKLQMALKCIDVSLHLKPALSINNLIKANILFKLGDLENSARYANYAQTINTSYQKQVSPLLDKIFNLNPNIKLEKLDRMSLIKELSSKLLDVSVADKQNLYQYIEL